MGFGRGRGPEGPFGRRVPGGKVVDPAERRDAGRDQEGRDHGADQDTIHFLLDHHAKIRRSVRQLPDGVETVTESDEPEIADRIKEHVGAMKRRVERPDPIRMRDPLFREIFRHYDKIEMKIFETENGAKVIETSEDPYVARLIQSHAEVVSGFVARGFAEARENHPVPTR